MVGFVDWHFLRYDISSIKSTLSILLSSFVNEGLGSIRQLSFHETEILLTTHGRPLIPSDIYVLYWVLLQEALEGTQWVHTGVRHGTRLEPFGSIMN